MDELERIAAAAYRPVYGADAVVAAGATCYRAPAAPDSPMLNRVVGLAVDAEATDDDLDEIVAAMGDTTFYVAVSPFADPRLDGLLERRGFEPGWGWMLFERGPGPPPAVRTELDVVEVGPAETAAWACIVASAYGLPEAARTMVERAPTAPGWAAFLALADGEPAAAAAVWLDPPDAYFGFAGTVPAHRGKGGQGALFAARIERALAAGCTRLVTETGERREGLPSDSYRNILRSGFEERFVVANRLRRRQSTEA